RALDRSQADRVAHAHAHHLVRAAGAMPARVNPGPQPVRPAAEERLIARHRIARNFGNPTLLQIAAGVEHRHDRWCGATKAFTANERTASASYGEIGMVLVMGSAWLSM